jgi:hypothetical protein
VGAFDREHAMKRKVIIAVAVVLVALLAGVALFLIHGNRSAAGRRWIAAQLSAVAGYYLNPRLSLGAVHYQYPLMAVVDDARLVADDPARPGVSVDIFVAKRVTLEMAEIPRRGQPLRVQKLILDHPEFRAVTVSEKDSSLVGYSHLLKGQPAAAQPEVKLSDVFEIRMIQVVDGLMVYDPRTPGAKPMEIDQINLRLDAAPATGGEAGWYTMAMGLDRKPVFATRFAGRMNINTMVVDMLPLRVKLELGREQDHYLPPQIQAFLREHELSGDLVVEVNGSVQTTDWRASSLKAQATLTGGHFATGDHQIPVDRLEVLWTMADRRGTFGKIDSDLMGGRLEGTGQVALDAAMDGRFDLRLTNIRLEQSLRNRAGTEGGYEGSLSGQIDWHGPLTAVLTQSRGSGTIRIDDGRLDQSPILSDLLASLGKAMRTAGMESGRPSDTADLAFTFEGNRVNFSRIDVVTTLAALHGHGDIYFDTRLDMVFNTGPAEKIESMLGKVGALVGRMTDQVSAYSLTGTLKDPKVGLDVAPNM